MALNEGILEGGKAGAKKRRRRWVKFHASLLALKMQHFVFGNTSTLTPKTGGGDGKEQHVPEVREILCKVGLWFYYFTYLL